MWLQQYLPPTPGIGCGVGRLLLLVSYALSPYHCYPYVSHLSQKEATIKEASPLPEKKKKKKIPA